MNISSCSYPLQLSKSSYFALLMILYSKLPCNTMNLLVCLSYSAADTQTTEQDIKDIVTRRNKKQEVNLNGTVVAITVNAR